MQLHELYCVQDHWSLLARFCFRVVAAIPLPKSTIAAVTMYRQYLVFLRMEISKCFNHIDLF